MDITAEDAQELAFHAAHVRWAKGLSFADALRQVKAARDEYGIAPRIYTRDRLYLLPVEELPKLKRRDRYVSIVAEQRRVPYARAFATMWEIRDRYGIEFREFAAQKLYRFGNEEGLTRAIRRLIAREGKHIAQVCHETGWSFEQAERRMREVKAKWPAMDFRKFVGYRLAAQSDEDIRERVRTWGETASINREKVVAETGWLLQKVQSHMARFQILYDIIPAYYMCYRAWELTDEQIDGYARQKLSEILAGRLNSREDTELLGRKDAFDAIYAEYVRRRFWVNEDSSFEEFLAFAEGLEEAFCKPLRSGGGLGTFTLDLTGGEEALRRLYDDLVTQPLILVEEMVTQHPEVSAFYPDAVSTVRVVTLQDEDGTHIISTGIRFGNEGITDNFSGNGMVCDVDIDTGVIVTPAVDKKGVSYEAHPHSGKPFVGFQVPYWRDVIEMAERAMDVLPGVNYVGWDIAIGPDGVSLIEGNSRPDLVLVQAPNAPMKVGKRYLFDPFLERTAPKRKTAGKVPEPKADAATSLPAAAAPAAPASESGRPTAPDGVVSTVLASAAGRRAVRLVRRVRRRLRSLGGRSRSESPRAEEAPTETDVVEEGGVRYAIRGGRATVVGHSRVGARLVIPEAVRGVPVARIGVRALADCETLVELSLPETLVEVGSHAFARCTSLAAVELPGGIEVLNKGAFEGATALVEVGLPYGLRRIGMECFKDCGRLEAVYYYSKRGISDVMTTDRSLRENVLPTLVDYIGPGAFENCTSLTGVDIPYQVTKIPPRAYAGCTSLTRVALHNRIEEIGAGAFRECEQLTSVRVSARCKKIGEEAFASSTLVIAGANSHVAQFARSADQPWRVPAKGGVELSSRMHPRGASEPHVRFYTDEQLTAAVERYETREPSFPPPVPRPERALGEIPPSRFALDGEVYRGETAVPGRARIMMVGDLMTRFRQQKAASEDFDLQFDASFTYVRELLAQADFAIGNLESTVSPSAPYTLEAEHVNARPHLNSPATFLAALRRAGFDAVTTAQNHIYDAGTRGVFETLDAVNEAQLMHTGAYVSPRDSRFLVVDLGGIRVGAVAYLDSARQMMKKANFTKTGLKVLFPYIEEEKVVADIAAARAAGAEFVFAFCHWGREYTPVVTRRQRGFAQLVADAGADYIVGAHSHCIQPYEVLNSADGRVVPCLWSAGNFISDINLKPPITRDTLVMDVTLQRDDEGRVALANESYHPCRILNVRAGNARNYVVAPTAADLGGRELNASLTEAQQRIVEVIGSGIRMVQ